MSPFFSPTTPPCYTNNLLMEPWRCDGLSCNSHEQRRVNMDQCEHMQVHWQHPAGSLFDSRSRCVWTLKNNTPEIDYNCCAVHGFHLNPTLDRWNLQNSSNVPTAASGQRFSVLISTARMPDGNAWSTAPASMLWVIETWYQINEKHSAHGYRSTVAYSS